MNGFPLLTLITLVPLIAGIIVSGLGSQKRLARNLALFSSLLSLGLAVVLWKSFDAGSGELQFVEKHDWIPALGVSYFVGVDGLGLLMVLLTAIVTFLALLASWGRATSPLAAAGRSTDSALYHALILFLQAGLFGTFTALNFFHWFIFWELSLIPAFFLVRLFGGPQRAPAATQFFVYTMVGSVAMLLAFLAIFLATSKPGVPGVFDFIQLGKMAARGELNQALVMNLGWFSLTGKQLATVIFCGVLLGFAVKVPLMPFHTWLPATYAEAPSPVTMLLTGVMSKMGVYGFLRILLPIFPEQVQWLRTPLLVLAIITIVFSAAAAFAQRDLKRILAYSSINHLGYCLLGVFAVATTGDGVIAPAVQKAAAFNGVLLQMFNHGLTAATLFLFVGFIEQRAGGLRGLHDFGGLRKVAPVFCGLMGVALFSSLGLPGLNGFVGEFLIFKGVFPLAMCSASIAVLGLLITAIFILTILQRVFNGPLNEKWARFPDLSPAECVMVALPIGLMFVLGLWPQWILGMVNNTVGHWVAQLNF